MMYMQDGPKSCTFATYHFFVTATVTNAGAMRPFVNIL